MESIAAFVGMWLVGGGWIFGRRFYRIATRALRRVSGWFIRELENESTRWEATRDRVGAALHRALAAVTTRLRSIPAALPSGGTASKPARLPDVLVVFVTLLGCIAAITNQVLLADILPDLVGIAPKDRLVGVGKVVTVVAPTAILLGEALGGLMYIRRAIGLGLFAPAFGLEVFAALRRAVEIVALGAEVVDNGQRFVAYSHAGAYMALGLALPWLVFSAGRFLEPALVGATPSSVLRRAAVVLWTVARNLVVLAAVVVLGLAYAGSWLLCTVAISLWKTQGRIIEILVEPVFELVLVVGSWVPWFILQRFVEAARALTAWRMAEIGVGAGLLLLMHAASACSQITEPTSYATVADAPGGQREISPDQVLAIPASELRTRLWKRLQVVRLADARLTVCIVDATESIPKTYRQLSLRACADFVGGLPPEHAGAVILVSDAGLTSLLHIVWRDPSAVVRRCVAAQSLPDLPTQSTLYDLAFADVRAKLDREVKHCSKGAELAYQEALRIRDASKDAFVQAALTELETRVFAKTDLMGTVARMPEIIAQADRRAGFAIRGVDIHVISDLIDDVRCQRAEIGACDQQMLARVREVAAREATRLLVHQVVVPPPASQAAADTWRTLWASVVPEASIDTWDAEARLSQYRLASREAQR